MATSTITEEAEASMSLNLRLQIKQEESEDRNDSNKDHGTVKNPDVEERSDHHPKGQNNVGKPNPLTKTGKNKNMCLRKSQSAQSIDIESKANEEKKQKSKSYGDIEKLSESENKLVGIHKQYSTPDIDAPYDLNDTMSNLQLEDDEERSDAPPPLSFQTSICSMTSQTSTASLSGSFENSEDIGSASQMAEPSETGGKKDIMIIHTDDDANDAWGFRCHLQECLQRHRPSIELLGNHGLGQSYIESLRGLSDQYRLLLVFTETLCEDIVTKQSVEMVQMDGLRNRSTPDNVWHKLIPVLARREARLPFSLGHLRPLKYWIHLQGELCLRQSYVENLENLLIRARNEDP